MLSRSSYLLMLLAVAGLHAQAQDARVVTRVVTDTLPAWKTWKTDAGSMNYPGTWEMDTEVRGDTVATFREVAEGTVAGFPEVCLVIRENKGRPASVKQGMKELPGEEVQIIASSGPDATGAYSIEYTGSINGVMHHGLRKVQVNADRSYILSYLATAEEYGERLFLAEAMMNSFSVPDGR